MSPDRVRDLQRASSDRDPPTATPPAVIGLDENFEPRNAGPYRQRLGGLRSDGVESRLAQDLVVRLGDREMRDDVVERAGVRREAGELRVDRLGQCDERRRGLGGE